MDLQPLSKINKKRIRRQKSQNNFQGLCQQLFKIINIIMNLSPLLKNNLVSFRIKKMILIHKIVNQIF